MIERMVIFYTCKSVCQNAPQLERVFSLESGALDRSAILTTMLKHDCAECCFLNYWYAYKSKLKLEDPGIDPGTSRMLSERSTI